MKTTKLFTIIFITLTLFGCKKEKPNLLRGPFYGNANAQKNGSDWKADFVGCRYNIGCNESEISMEFEVVNNEGFLRESLALFNISNKPGLYKIFAVNNTDFCNDTLTKSFYGTSIDDGDVAGDAYDVLATENNYINITDYNPVTKEIRGNYQVSFLVTLKKDPLAPDTLRFTNGNFYTKILE